MKFRFSNCVLDVGAHVSTRDGSIQSIGPQVFDLLHLSVRSAGDLVTRDQMVEEIWRRRVVSESAI